MKFLTSSTEEDQLRYLLWRKSRWDRDHAYESKRRSRNPEFTFEAFHCCDLICAWSRIGPVSHESRLFHPSFFFCFPPRSLLPMTSDTKWLIEMSEIYRFRFSYAVSSFNWFVLQNWTLAWNSFVIVYCLDAILGSIQIGRKPSLTKNQFLPSFRMSQKFVAKPRLSVRQLQKRKSVRFE